VAAVRRQGRHPVLQGKPSRLGVPCGGDDDQGPVTVIVKRSSLRKRRWQRGEFVARAAVLAGQRGMEALHLSSVRRQAGEAGVNDQASHADSSPRRQQRKNAAEATVEGRVTWKGFERFGGLGVE
jgi:hypothetical protein